MSKPSVGCIRGRMKIPIHFDMETQDPDDVMTLALLACHPRSELVGVSISPGGPDQVGLVRHILSRFGLGHVQIGIGRPNPEKKYVSEFHTKWLGFIPESEPDGSASDVIASALRLHPGTTLLTGANLTNIASFLQAQPKLSLQSWVGQGGFCGDSVVPPEHRLPKFAGRETCPTFNFNGDVAAAHAVLGSRHIQHKVLVGKNVCHGVTWDKSFHAQVLDLPKRTAGVDLVLEGMGLYLRKNPDGKKLHDPLAACVILRGNVVQVREVEVYRQKGEWGSKLLDPDRLIIERGSQEPILAAISYDPKAFFEVLTET